MSKKTKNIVGQVGLVVCVCAVIGIGAYRIGKNRTQEESSSPAAESLLVQHESEQQNKTLDVSPDGNDTNPGTQESPKKTVGAAVSDAKEGDTIVTKPRTSGGG